MKRNGFTVMEMMAVLVILSILVLVVTPSMNAVYSKFKERNNETLYEQLYKASRSYYLEKRASANVDDHLVPVTFTAGQTFIYQSWEGDIGTSDIESGATYQQIKIKIDDLATAGLLKPKLINDTKKSLKISVSDNIYVYLIGRVSTEKTFIIVEYAIGKE